MAIQYVRNIVERINKPSENIVIRYSKALAGAGGVICGSETAGMIRNLYVHDCVFTGTHNGLYFKTRRTRGGGGENLHYERIRLNVPGPAFRWDMLGSKKWVGELAERIPAREVTPLTPVYRNIFIKDIAVENCQQLISATAIPESPLGEVSFYNITATCEDVMSIQDVDGFTIEDASISTKSTKLSILCGYNVFFRNMGLNVLKE